MDYLWFFDRYGKPQIVLYNQDKFADRTGKNLGYINNNQIFNYRGKHCGWIEGFTIRDLYGHTVGFCEYSSDPPSPIFPIPQIPSIPAIPQIPLIPAIPQIPRIRPLKSFGWSHLSLQQLFN